MAAGRPRVAWAPEAEADLGEVWRYLAEHASATTADAQLRAIGRKIEMLVDWPQSGRSRDELAPGLRSVAVGSFVIFCRLSDGPQIVRVLHGSRDIERLLPDH